MTNLEYIELARRDSTWQDIVASFAIEGLALTEQNEIIAGKLISGAIDLSEAKRLILEAANVTKCADHGPMAVQHDT